MRNLISLLLVVWLVIGAFAAFQRGYFGGNDDVNCSTAADAGLTIIAGPLNYLGANPKIKCKDVKVPQPSK